MNKKILSLVILCVAFLAGCGRPYQVKPLKHVKREEAHFVEQKDGIELRLKKLDYQDVANVFNGRYILNKRVAPLLITIENNSPVPLIIDQENFSITLLSSKRLHTSLSRATSSNLLIGLCALPLVLPLSFGVGAATFGIADACGFFAECTGGTMLAAGLLVFVPAFIISAGIEISVIVGTTGYSMYHDSTFNKVLETDIKRKILTKLVIAAGKEESALLFTKDLPESFTITLLKGQEKVPFTVTLKNIETPKVKQPKTKK